MSIEWSNEFNMFKPPTVKISDWLGRVFTHTRGHQLVSKEQLVVCGCSPLPLTVCCHPGPTYTHHLTMAEGAHNITQLILILNRTEENVKTLAVESDKFFLIVMSIIIFFMQCGFAFLEAGSVRYYMNVFH